jgi:hypothetical protein
MDGPLVMRTVAAAIPGARFELNKGAGHIVIMKHLKPWRRLSKIF